jgi:NADPH2:quinone reductase
MSNTASVRAVVVDPSAPGRLALRPVDRPTPGTNEALVRVAAFSLNRGEVRRAMGAEPGWRPGWDVAGTVERAAANGTGPAVGARVVGFLVDGGWAEQVAVPTDALAELPAEVSFAQAATLPVAGLTALHAVERGGPLLDRAVLVTGASGGVGHFATQLAALGGARVVGLVRQAGHADLVRAAGAATVVVAEDAAPAAAHGPYHLVVDSVGGRTLSTALDLLAPGGTCVNLGVSAGREVTFDASAFFGRGGATLYGLILRYELRREPASEGLARLMRLIVAGKVHPRIDVEAPWTEVAEIARRLIDRQYVGKAVLHVAG